MKPNHPCKHLRTKEMLVPALAHQPSATPGEEAGRAGHYWCNQTLTEVGPDDHPVGEQVCKPGRACAEE